MICFTLNGETREIDADPDKPLLWVLRDDIGLTGTKYGCGQALCGACTVHVDGAPVRSCVTNIGDVAGKSVVTIEGVAGAVAAAVQKSWIKLDVPQCGYCQSGQVMAADLAAHRQQETERCRNRRSDERQYLPLRNLSSHPRRRS